MIERTDSPFVPARTWPQKFQDAFRGLTTAIRGQSSFHVHCLVAGLVFVCGMIFGVSRVEWCLLVLCITLVMALEAMNSALETLAKAIDQRFNPQLGRALDMASGAVLAGSFGAALVGLIIFIYRLIVWLGWQT